MSARAGEHALSRWAQTDSARHQHLDLSPGATRRAWPGLEQGKFRGITSELTLLELTVQPLRLGRQDAADDYEVLLDYFPNLELIPVSREILLDAAALRARQRLRAPDAIQIATALRADATLAVTNDKAWRSLPLIDVVLLPELME